MTPTTLLQVLRGPFNFLRGDPDEIRRIVPDLGKTLPQPSRIFLEDESATPIRGFPILVSDGLLRLRETLERYVSAEVDVQVATQARIPHDRKRYRQAWESYKAVFARAVENVTLSSYGRHYPAIFWLHHSLDLARLLKEAPRLALHRDLEIGRRHGDHIKYRVLEKYLDSILHTSYDLVSGLALDTDEAEEELFPRLLTHMRDNVLILTEDHVSPDLAELGSYFNGYLGIDGRDLRQRLAALEAWHAKRLAKDRDLQDAVRHLLGEDPGADPRWLLLRSGYVAYLTGLRGYDTRKLLAAEHVEVWESLLVKLKEFELLHDLRRFLRPVEREGGRLVSRGTAAGGTRRERRTVYLSPTTRAMDFLAPWVVDPLVSRSGLIYDITDFSEIVSVLRRSGSEDQDVSFRKMFRFQRRINRLAAGQRMTLEKYLGDGAFYSSRKATYMLRAAILIQRHYREELEAGFPFDRGMRIALNHGQYRLIPIGRDGPGEAQRYEFFGHGLVELSRLTTGKTTREIDEIKTMLISYGYPSQTVNRFFEPLQRSDVDRVDRQEERRPFRAYINSTGSLINEGIVTTASFIARLEESGPWENLRAAGSRQRTYVVIPLGEGLTAGVRKLGRANLKGLDQLPVYEIIDGADLEGHPQELPDGDLDSALERVFARDLEERRGHPEALG